jgi:hypothetical protein
MASLRLSLISFILFAFAKSPLHSWGVLAVEGSSSASSAKTGVSGSSTASAFSGQSSGSTIGSSVPPTLASSSSNPTGTLSSTQPPTETGRHTIPISDYSFTSFPPPTQAVVAGVFPSADPKNPPAVQADRKVVLDFGPAWAAAYGKAKAKVRLHFFFSKHNTTSACTRECLLLSN